MKCHLIINIRLSKISLFYYDIFMRILDCESVCILNIAGTVNGFAVLPYSLVAENIVMLKIKYRMPGAFPENVRSPFCSPHW